MKAFLVKSAVIFYIIFTSAFLTAEDAKAQNYDNAQKVEKFLTELYSQPETIKKVVAMFRVSPDKEAILSEYFMDIFSNTEFIKVMSREVVAQGVLEKSKAQDNKSAYPLGMAFGYQFVTKLSIDGMKRLSDERVLEYINLTGKFFDWIEPKNCRALMGASSQQKDEIEASFVAIRNMGASELRALFGLNKDAITAELNDWPSVATLNDYETKTATEVYEKAFLKGLESHPAASKILIVLTDPLKAQDRDFCIAGKFVSKTIAELDGMAGDWFRRSFVLAL